MQNGSALKETKKFDLSRWYFHIYRQVYKTPCMSSLSGLRSLGWALRIHVCHPLVGITPQSNHTCSTTTLPHLRWKVLRATMSRSLRGVFILVHSSRTPCPEPASVDFSSGRAEAQLDRFSQTTSANPSSTRETSTFGGFENFILMIICFFKTWLSSATSNLTSNIFISQLEKLLLTNVLFVSFFLGRTQFLNWTI